MLKSVNCVGIAPKSIVSPNPSNNLDNILPKAPTPEETLEVLEARKERLENGTASFYDKMNDGFMPTDKAIEFQKKMVEIQKQLNKLPNLPKPGPVYAK